MQTIHDFILAHDIRMTATRIEARTDFQKEFRGASHWKCVFTMVDADEKRHCMTAEYSMGAAHDHRIGPRPGDVLDCLAMDAQSVRGQGFEEWCEDFGYDSDSRKHEKTYKACCRTLAKLEKFFAGEQCTDQACGDALMELLERTERL